MRSDIHRPSVLVPADYVFVGPERVSLDDCPDPSALGEYELECRERLAAHMRATGGRFSAHSHGGSCHVCGANAVYTCVFHHTPTNTYVRTGRDCADSICAGGYFGDFERLRREVNARKVSLQRRDAARALLDSLDLSAAWDVWEAVRASSGQELPYEEDTVYDVVSGVIRWGNVTDRQRDFLSSLLARIAASPASERSRSAQQARWAAEKAIAKDAPSGRVTVEGEIVKTETRDTGFGIRCVMTVKTVDGWLAWGSIPDAIGGVQRGDKVRFVASVTPSDKDPKFAFYKRPAKPEKLNNQ